MRQEYEADSLESHLQSFIVRIWLEDPSRDAHEGPWRGLITHVPSGERRYLTDLDEITAFIASYLQRMGVEPGKRHRSEVD